MTPEITTVADVERGERVHVKGWGPEVFRVEGTSRQRNTSGQWVDLVDVRSLDGAVSGSEDPQRLTRAGSPKEQS